MIELLKRKGLIQGNNLKICDGIVSFNAVRATLIQLESIYNFYKIPISEIGVCFEIENADNTALFFEGELFQEDAIENGLHYCSRIHSKSKMIFLKDYPKMSFQEVSTSLSFDFFLTEFGFSSKNVKEMLIQAMNVRYPELQTMS